MILTPGSSRGKNTVASAGLFTNLLMFAMIMVVFRMMGVSFARSPRMRSGTMMASAGDSTACTKVVPLSFVMASTTSMGRAIHESMDATQGSMSLLPCSLKQAAKVAQDAFLTWSRASTKHSDPTGTSEVRAACTADLHETASLPTRMSAPSFVCQAFSRAMASIKAMSTRGADAGLSSLMSIDAAASAALQTGLALSEYLSIMRPSMGTR
mmetsp:Transcript_21751/g.37085  ORF Transcript_21751/g.37085 Transcript_21751/m.37085 type:complete len:211 (+) Transcript_21751:2800-3432(+)